MKTPKIWQTADPETGTYGTRCILKYIQQNKLKSWPKCLPKNKLIPWEKLPNNNRLCGNFNQLKFNHNLEGEEFENKVAETLLWAADNCKGEWHSTSLGKWFFENNDDMLKFKLIFGGKSL